MTTYNKVHSAVLLVLVSMQAQAFDPAAIDYDGVSVTPTIEVAGSFDDNYTATPDPQSSWVVTVSPAINVVAFGEKSTYELNYSLNHNLYNAAGAENLTNHFASAKAEFEFDVRNRLDLEANMTLTESAADTFTFGELNSFRNTVLSANYTYGAPSATGNIKLGVSQNSKRSTNGENKDQESDVKGLNAAFIYKATAKTRLTAEIDTKRFDYVSNDGLDSRNISYLIGAQWDATARTTGQAKIGKQNKYFDDADERDTQLTNWEVSVDWAPKTYSVFSLGTQQGIAEGTFDSDYTDTRSHNLSWKYDWGRGWASTTSLGLVNRDYSNAENRKDDVRNFGIGVSYLFRRWMDISLDYQHTNQESSNDNFDYKRNLIQLNVNVGL